MLGISSIFVKTPEHKEKTMLRYIVRMTGRSVGPWRQHFPQIRRSSRAGPCPCHTLLAACGSVAEATPEPETQPATIVDIAVGDGRRIGS